MTPENLDPHVVELCRQVIEKNLGRLDDLPRELANTVVNVYYRFLSLAQDVTTRAKRNPNWLPPRSDRHTDVKGALVGFYGDATKCLVDSESVKGFVEGLRRVDKVQQARLYVYTVEFILDCLKYDIRNASQKSYLRRRLERTLRKNKVNEIDNLVDKIWA